jgi:2-hydroxycyclohexanecarboxyl-CoA dehydrogenase
MGMLEGRVCLVTGAVQGIGRGVVVRMAKEGARVAVNARLDDERLQAIVSDVGGLPVPADITDPDAVRAMVSAVEANLGPIDVLVCNAARTNMKPFLEQPREEWWEPVHTNLSGHMDVISGVLPGMRRLGRGWIVIIASMWGLTGWENATAYTAGKSGLISLGRALGRELAPEGIYCSLVAPGVIDTPALQPDADFSGVSLEEMRSIYAKGIPVGRVGTPDDVAGTVVFLCTDTAAVYAGQILHPNGGEIRWSQ